MIITHALGIDHMDKENCFGRYSLCSESLSKLNAIEELVSTKNSDSETAHAWRVINWEEPESTTVEEQGCEINEDAAENQIPCLNQDLVPELTQATQYGFSQMDRLNTSFDPTSSIGNLTEFIYESLEHGNGKLDVESLQNITDNELSIVVNDLSKKLSHKGIYNLCHSVCDMEIEVSERFASFLCRDIFLNAVGIPNSSSFVCSCSIIATEEPSRLLNAAIAECVLKFPHDVQYLTFVPALNFDLKEVTTILSITSKLNVQQKRAYISDFSNEVKDLKQWHIFILQDLLVANLDENAKEKVLNLLWKKSYDFSKDKNFGKIILNLIKTNPPINANQKNLYEEIVSVHNTLFKKLIDKILENITIV